MENGHFSEAFAMVRYLSRNPCAPAIGESVLDDGAAFTVGLVMSDYLPQSGKTADRIVDENAVCLPFLNRGDPSGVVDSLFLKEFLEIAADWKQKSDTVVAASGPRRGLLEVLNEHEIRRGTVDLAPDETLAVPTRRDIVISARNCLLYPAHPPGGARPEVMKQHGQR